MRINITPAKLKSGDIIRVISPSRSMSLLSWGTIDLATTRLTSLGLNVTFSKNVLEKDRFLSSTIESRIADLHEAFIDPAVKGIFTTIGGFNCNQLLSYIDYNLIQNNPKIFCGFSDITALATAIHTKTGLVTYSGPHFSTFAMKRGLDYTLEHFCKCLFENEDIELRASEEWSNDAWWEAQEEREFHKNPGWTVLNRGTEKKLEGKILGGNISALAALHGTQYMPKFDQNTILYIEECQEQSVQFFDRILQSIIHQEGFGNVKALLIGRFEKTNGMSPEFLEAIINSKNELKNLLVVANLDFGHTTPIFTFPIGGYCSIDLTKELLVKIHGDSK